MKANSTKQGIARLFFLIFLTLLATQSFAEKNNNFFSLSNIALLQVWKNSRYENYLTRNHTLLVNNNKSFNDVTMNVTNYAHAETQIYLYSQDSSYYFELGANQFELSFTIPEGQYDVTIYAGTSGDNNTVYLGYYQSGSYYYEFNGVYLNSSNNVITVE